MKFEQKYANAKVGECHGGIQKTNSLGVCQCGSYTRWANKYCHVCSEECNLTISLMNSEEFYWNSNAIRELLQNHKSQIDTETAFIGKEATKDIIVVVRDQLPYVKVCFESILKHTSNYKLYVWDNNSANETKNYLHNLFVSNDRVELIRSDTNLGFVEPNNELVRWGEGEYIILINSDTKVFAGWADLMVAYLQNNPDVAQVGYWGGYLDAEAKGFGGSNGSQIDYVPGWCFCISRETYTRFGLFNPKLKFAYCEDADFSLRLKEAGKKIYALYSPLVHHFQNKTINAVHKEGLVDVRSTFEYNHAYMRTRWAEYIRSGRVLLQLGGS